MRTFIVGVFVVFLGCVVATAEDVVYLSVGQIVEKIIRGEGFDTLVTLEADMKNDVREAIRVRKDTFQKGRPRDFALTALINLGDTNAMCEVVELRVKFENYGVGLLGETLQENCNQPEFLPFLARELMTEEPVDVRFVEDVHFERVSVNAARIMRQILLKSPTFSGEVKKWATSLDVRNRSAMRDSMRKWWLANQEHVVRKEYEKAVVVPVAE
jgi:hypothetical protein